MIQVQWYGLFLTPSGKNQTHHLVFRGVDVSDVHQQIRDHVQRFTDNDYKLVENEIKEINVLEDRNPT